MPEPDTQLPAHPQFDSLCSAIEEYEPLPDGVAAPAAGDDGLAASIDEEILGGLVSP